MSAGLLWDNVVAYSLQIGLLVGLAALAPAALRLRMPRARLLYWHLLLAACLLLPLMRPMRQTVLNDKIVVTTTITAMAPAAPSPRIHLSSAQAALALLAAGVLVRLAWLGVGLWRLRRYRRHSLPLEPASPWAVEGDLRISDEVVSPVTFGYRHPVVLLPPQFPELERARQEAILCHEILHIRRRDWLVTLAEEVVRAVFWFHPAIWWLLGEIQLTREQAVDREVIELTKSRDEYVDALLAMAGARAPLDLAPAPLFLRKRHLKQRVVSILKEAGMSKKRWITALAAATGVLAAACWFVTGAFPLVAAPQTVNDAPGVTVDANGAPLMHRTSVAYPPEARAAGVQGTVVLQVKVDGRGEVEDISVLSGPDQLRRSAIQSVLNWHFMKEAAGSTRQVRIAYELPKESPAATAATAAGATLSSEPRASAAVVRVDGVPGGIGVGVGGGVGTGVIGGVGGGVPGGVGGGVIGGVIARTPVRPIPEGAKVGRIVIAGLSDEAKAQLLSQLPVHEGDALDEEQMNKVRQAVHEFDSHLAVGVGSRGGTEMQISIMAPGASPAMALAPAPPGSIRVGGDKQQAMLVSQPRPVYPPLAKQARVQGTVSLQAIIGPDGHVQNLTVISGHPLLVQAALDAVKDWVYKPTLLNGNPVTVVTVIDVNFTLSE